MSSLSRLDVPLVYGTLKDRWFVVLKNAGFVAASSKTHPSVESVLRPFCGGRDLSFPIRPEMDTEGLLIVTTDSSMRKCFDEFVRRRLIKSRFRVLADVSSISRGENVPTALGLPFVGFGGVSSRRVLGSLSLPGGGLTKSGRLVSHITSRPVRLRAYNPVGDRLDEARDDQSGIAGRSVWTNESTFRSCLEGEAVPPGLTSVVAKSLLSHSSSLQSLHVTPSMAVTEFELESGPTPCPAQPSLHTAIYRARILTSAPHQIRAQFASVGCPVLFDKYYHHQFNEELRRKAYHRNDSPSKTEVDGQSTLFGDLGLQLCELELPDPIRPSNMLRIALDTLPSGWDRLHPTHTV